MKLNFFKMTQISYGICNLGEVPGCVRVLGNAGLSPPQFDGEVSVDALG